MELFWKINKTMSEKILNLWIQKFKDHLEHKNYIQTPEFLYLLCNTFNKLDILDKLPRLPFVIKRDHANFNLFSVEQELLKKNWDLDVKIQNHFNSIYFPSKAILESRDIANKKKEKQINQKQVSKKEEKMEFGVNYFCIKKTRMS